MRRQRQRGRALVLGVGLAMSGLAVADDVEALLRGQAIMQAKLGDYAAAAALLEGAPRPAARRAPETEWLLGELYRDYGMPRNAERVFRQIIARGVTSAQRSQAWMGLAQMRYQRGQLDSTEDALAYVAQDLPPDQAIERLRMQASVLLDKGHAARVVRLLEAAEVRAMADPYLDYNYAIALNAAGQQAQAITILQRLGQASASTEEQQAVRDRANLALAALMANHEDTQAVLEALERVRRDGPYTVERLQMRAQTQERQQQWKAARADWQALRRESEREVVPVETWLRAAYAAEQAGERTLANEDYREAIKDYDGQIAALQQAIATVEQTRWETLLVDQPSSLSVHNAWTRYLPALMASHGFRSALNDLADAFQLKQRLRLLANRLADSRLALEARKQQLPAALQAHDVEQTAARLQGAQRLAAGLEPQLARLTNAKPGAGGSDAHRAISERLAKAEVRLRAINDDSLRQPLLQRLTRLRGMMLWESAQAVATGQQRLREQWQAISSGLANAQATRQRLIASQEALARSLEVNEARMLAMPSRLAEIEAGLSAVIDSRRTQLVRLAQQQLAQRRDGLVQSQDQARYALARLLDAQAADAAGQRQ